MLKCDRTFLITGASKGIGLVTAQQLGLLGYSVIGVAREKPTVKFPGIFHTADLSVAQATEDLFYYLKENYQIDGIVNNVGIAMPQALPDISMENFYSVLDLNLRPALQAMQIFMGGMVERGFGRVVNISSRAVLGIENRSSYAAAKSGLIAFTRCWALELAASCITVNAVAPGPTDTALFRLHHAKGSEREQQVLKDIPMKRIGSPYEISAAVEFFLSEKASFITGQTLFVDGGASIGKQSY